jgi:flavin-dependent thymidylate synthase
MSAADWIWEHRANRPYVDYSAVQFSRVVPGAPSAADPLVHVAETAFNNHSKNTGAHVSPFDTGLVQVGVDGLEVRLLQGIDIATLAQVTAAGTEATIGRPRPKGAWPMSDDQAISDERWHEMFRGGLQAALESQTVVFEVWGASRVLTHQLVRSRRAGFHQQSQRSTWYGDRPEVRMPETVWRAPELVRAAWAAAYLQSWVAYQVACEAGIPYEDARYILPEGTVNYIICEYTIREFIAVYAYRGCSMFLREMVEVMRAMRSALIAQCPELEPFIKISCEKSGKECAVCEGSGKVWPEGEAWDPNDIVGNRAILTGDPTYIPIECPNCGGPGGRKCTFQGWENVELACDFPWAKEDNRVFVAAPHLRIGAKT